MGQAAGAIGAPGRRTIDGRRFSAGPDRGAWGSGGSRGGRLEDRQPRNACLSFRCPSGPPAEHNRGRAEHLRDGLGLDRGWARL